MSSAIFVFGAAGAGKTTFCKNFIKHVKATLVNLDPASIDNDHYDITITDYISNVEIMEELDLGPNGGIFECLSYLEEIFINEEVFEDRTILFDCPGQIEIFLHSDLLVNFIKKFQSTFDASIAYITDGTTLGNTSKYLFNNLTASIAINRFSLPVINFISKMDVKIEREIEFEDDNGYITIKDMDNKDKFINSVNEFIELYGMYRYIPLDWDDDLNVDFIFSNLSAIID